jgi:Tfp pilus assembly protein PilO
MYREVRFPFLIRQNNQTLREQERTMASGSQNKRVLIQVVLGVLILCMGYFLYISITEPWEAVERQEELTDHTRQRMSNIRAALIRFDEQNGRFPGSLDSLHIWVQTDSATQMHSDSIFGSGTNLDSFIVSPRTGKQFEYEVNDTSRVMMYLLSDPDSDDEIGSLEPDPTRLNAATWE